MVSGATPRLTRISFRRDIKFFLAALVGFLIVVILTLVLLLQTTTAAAGEQFQARWEFSADAATDAITLGSASGSDAESLLISARSRFGIDGIALKRRAGGATVLSGLPATAGNTTTVTRENSAGTLTFVFDATPLQALQRKFLLTAGICIAATILGTLLLLLYLPRITGPIERMLDSAASLGERGENVDEAHYLIETFKSSIARLKDQESELKRLHDAEKSRADELQLITATLTRSLTSGFVAIDAEGRIVDLNSAAREILKLADRNLGGVSVEHAFGTQAFTRHLQHALDERKTVSRQEVTYASEDADVVVGLTTVPLVGEEAKFLGVIALFADLTHVRSLEARVREMQTLADLGEISAGIAHEFRNSLSTILGYLKLAQRDALAQPAADRVRNAESEAVVLSRAVEGLLNFARPMQVEFQEADLAALAAETVERLRPTAEGVTIELDLEEAEILADRALLSRAIENLMRNALESVRLRHETGGKVSVRVRRTPTPRMEISDDGMGLDPADAPRLMLPFQSAKSTGLGLGLPLARKIVLVHGGTLLLDGKPGQGAVATLDFYDNHSLAATASAPLRKTPLPVAPAGQT